MTPRRSNSEKMIALMLIVVMNVFFIPVTTSAAPAPIGQIVTNGAASVTQAEATLFNGDRISTAAHQQMAVTLKNASLLNFKGSSSARISQAGGVYRVELEKGEMFFASSAMSPDALKIQSSNLEITIPRASGVSGRVQLTGNIVEVSALKGAVLVARNGESFAVREGESNVFPAMETENPDPGPSPQPGAGAGAGVGAASGWPFGWPWWVWGGIIGGAATGTTLGVYYGVRDTGEASPSRP